MEPGANKSGKFAFIGIGIVIGFGVLLGGKAGVDATSTDKFCDQTCHAHPEATQTWIKFDAFHHQERGGDALH